MTRVQERGLAPNTRDMSFLDLAGVELALWLQIFESI